MLSLLLITALAVQNPPASKPTQDMTASLPSSAAVSATESRTSSIRVRNGKPLRSRKSYPVTAKPESMSSMASSWTNGGTSETLSHISGWDFYLPRLAPYVASLEMRP